MCKRWLSPGFQLCSHMAAQEAKRDKTGRSPLLSKSSRAAAQNGAYDGHQRSRRPWLHHQVSQPPPQGCAGVRPPLRRGEIDPTSRFALNCFRQRCWARSLGNKRKLPPRGQPPSGCAHMRPGMVAMAHVLAAGHGGPDVQVRRAQVS